MERFFSLALLIGICSSSIAQNPLAIPPLIEADTFQLDVAAFEHQFYPGVTTSTMGVGVPYLGPTLVFHKGDTARLRVNNGLQEITNMHWHGLKVPGVMDGGPQREILPGGHWDVKYKVENDAGTYWYHPHTHMQTGTQATKGIAGFIIVRDELEAILELPRTYGVDDFPVVVQDRRFLPDGDFVIGPYGDSVLVNGTPHPYLDLPAQVVRLRLLNGSNARIYVLGLDNGSGFHVIAGDGGLLNAPVFRDRLWLANGERYEILLDLTGMEGDSLMLMSHGSELPSQVPGGNHPNWESSILNGVDFPLLRIRVGAATENSITTIPATLGAGQPPPLADVTRTRNKFLAGNGMVGTGMFMIDGLMFDMDVINDTVQLGSTEVWNITNLSNMAHPMHIHGVTFHVLERNGEPVPEWERGAKDVVLIDSPEQVKLIMRFDHPTEGWPFMYHCHNLMHEDNMMMLQFIVQDLSTSVHHPETEDKLQLFPSPTTSITNWRTTFPIKEITVFDMLGRRIVDEKGNGATAGTMDLATLPPGRYVIELRGEVHVTRGSVIKE